MKRKKTIRIEGYDGEQLIWSGSVPLQLGVGGIELLLQRLAASHLDQDDIVAASLKRNNHRYAPHLEVQKGDGYVSVGGQFHYVARLIEGSVA